MSESYETVVQLSKMLTNLGNWLGKGTAYAAQKKFEPSVLLHSRLSPDMYSLLKQVQAACDGAKFFAARLSGKEPPKHPDTEQTFEELQNRIQAVKTYLTSFKAQDFADAETRMIPLTFMPGKGLTGADFRREMSLPNTYFHFSMAYAILRNHGVELGKADYIGSLNIRDL